ncbi:MAG TPA: ABC transporter ATP-binding protein [Actinomycetota bacterium]|nr:ABC transporter ATP-binding protein [Actinomycetota bacterium]
MNAAAEGVALRCAGVTKIFDDAVALHGFDLTLRSGTLMALLGPSGCGKTTALRVIAGFEAPAAGEVWVGDRPVAGGGEWVPPEKRRIGMVFQEWALFPHLDVWHNIAFGLDRDDERVTDVIEMMDLNGFERRMPHELSGGQQQRVALGRALAPSPEVVLLDEPFSNLDATLRASVRAEVAQLLHDVKATAIFVTHDQEEALAMADEVAVMVQGRVLQVGSPHEVYGSPSSRRVASLVGEANFLRANVGRGRASTALGAIAAPGVPDGEAEVLVRPEAIELVFDEVGDARIVRTEFYGHDQLVTAQLADGTVVNVRLLGPHPELRVDARVRARLAGQARFFSNGVPV